MKDLERPVAVEEIKKLKARNFRADDTKDVLLFCSLFADDVVTDFRDTSADPITGVNCVPSVSTESLFGVGAAMAA